MSVLVLAYSTVLLAELVGDKTLYSLSALATTFRLGPILIGAAAAFALKMAVAVTLGHFVGDLPARVVSLVSAATFLAMAVAFLLKRPSPPPPERLPPPRFSRATLVCFAVVFLPEWGDPGQLAAALLVAHGSSVAVVWCGAVLAMLTKAGLGATLGIGLRRFVPQQVVRFASFSVCCVMGLLAAFRVDL